MHRSIVALLILIAFAIGIAGCGEDQPKDTNAGGSVPSGGATGQRQPRGELRVGVSRIEFPPTFDPIKSFGSSYAVRFGAGETLTRLTPELTIEPWLAESVTAVDPTTWRVTLRANARFHDGSPVTAADVAACFRQVLDQQPAATAFLPKETRVEVASPTTLTFTTPTPAGAFPNNLSSFYFPVFKQAGETAHYTGPYKLARLETDVQMTLQAFTEHWDGPPPLATIRVRVVADNQAKLLALQSGDLDLVTTLSPEQAKGLPGNIEAKVTPSLRVNYVQFNTARTPFADRAVREAFALGIDRAALNKAVFDGQGEVATGLFPANITGFDVLPLQATDASRARQVLEAAGWRAGSDGVRGKDGRRLAFTLYSYPGGAEPTAMAHVIQAQLKPLGFDIQVQERQDYLTLVSAGDFDAAMASFGTLPTGEPGYLYNVALAKDGSFNFGTYSSAQVETVLAQLRLEPDPAKRNMLSRQVQEIVRADMPYAVLITQPRIEGVRAGKVKNHTLHPSDFYLLDNEISVE